MIFDKYTIEEFNRLSEANILPTDTFHEFSDKIESAELSYFYVSMCREDIERAVEDEKDIAGLLNLRYIQIEDIGVYIATY